MISLGITDVVNKPAPINLPSGAVIVSERWVLDADCAEALHRPVHSIERNLRIRMADHSESATNPRASWYLSGPDYGELMELMRTGKLSFDAAKNRVDAVRSDADAAVLRNYINEHLFSP